MSKRFSIALRRHQGDARLVEETEVVTPERVDYRSLQAQAKAAGIPVKQSADKLQAALNKAEQ